MVVTILSKDKQWWLYVHIGCEACATIVQLGPSDPVKHHEHSVISFNCPNPKCGKPVVFSYNELYNRLLSK